MDSQSLQASACCKHFTAYDLDHWNNISRLSFDAKVSKQDLADTYQPPFKRCVAEGRASGIMCAYNRVNGVPNCADYNLLTKTARGEWGFDGYIASDCDGVSIIHDIQKYALTPEDAVADVLNAGMDVNCGTYLQTYTKSAIDKKKLSESQVDRALHNIFSVRMRLGLFNGNPKQQPFGNICPDQVCTEEHKQLALQAARNGIVLLKNTNNLLPLRNSQNLSLSVIGPNANNAYVLLGNYEGPPCESVEIYTALQRYAKNASYHSGCNDGVNCTSASIGDAVEIAKRAEQVVLVMGLDSGQETEDHDREILTLPGQQEALVKAVVAASKNPVVLVLVCGGPVDVSFARDEPKIGSILWAGYPGEAGGIALAEIIFGEHNPGGKLPVTWYPKDFINVPMSDMRMRPDPSSGYPGRTYRFYKGKKVFEFGHGLSYSNYSYDFINSTPKTIHLNQSTTDYVSVSDIGADVCESLKFSARVGVANTGGMAGKHPVLLFVRPSDGVLEKQLVGFESVSLNVGQRVEVEFILSPCEHLSSANGDGDMVIEKGYRHLVVEDKEYTINIVF
ncbi:putative beta-D-xylosidase 7 [Castilleja foliolosa]|uniref:Beta-D-xylosidase 7 n=1 Tax=Castilleja foliolosa TaxID=1961234 RepID=A0ABD3EMC3_9LAMI